jgi:hypothetical protein
MENTNQVEVSEGQKGPQQHREKIWAFWLKQWSAHRILQTQYREVRWALHPVSTTIYILLIVKYQIQELNISTFIQIYCVALYIQQWSTDTHFVTMKIFLVLPLSNHTLIPIIYHDEL